MPVEAHPQVAHLQQRLAGSLAGGRRRGRALPGRFRFGQQVLGTGGGGPVDLEALKPGVSVLHPDYGLGRIVAVDGAGANRKGRVAFAVGPERTFVLAKSPLRPVVRSTPDGQPPRR